jgi:hypothetical protein
MKKFEFDVMYHKQVILDVMYRKRIISFGIDLGSNKTKNNKPVNFFIEIGLLFWTFGFEICW